MFALEVISLRDLNICWKTKHLFFEGFCNEFSINILNAIACLQHSKHHCVFKELNICSFYALLYRKKHTSKLKNKQLF